MTAPPHPIHCLLSSSPNPLLPLPASSPLLLTQSAPSSSCSRAQFRRAPAQRAATDGDGRERRGGSEVDGPDGEEDGRGPGRRRSRAEAARAKRTQGRRPRAGRAKSVAGDQDLKVVPVRASPPCLLCSSIWLARFFI